MAKFTVICLTLVILGCRESSGAASTTTASTTTSRPAKEVLRQVADDIKRVCNLGNSCDTSGDFLEDALERSTFFKNPCPLWDVWHDCIEDKCRNIDRARLYLRKGNDACDGCELLHASWVMILAAAILKHLF